MSEYLRKCLNDIVFDDLQGSMEFMGESEELMKDIENGPDIDIVKYVIDLLEEELAGLELESEA